ncbi:MAG: hypothetical protein SOY62_07135 [Streptococcus orisratti]|nr:hypothetical protein [Streptococcus orisratti]
MVSEKEKFEFILYSQIVNAFLIKYSELEQRCKKFFIEDLEQKKVFSTANKHIDILYRLKYLKTNLIVDFANETLESPKLKKNLSYELLTLKEMTILGDKYDISEFFNNDLPLIRVSPMQQTMRISDILKVLINIRNTLAHETSILNLSESKYQISTVSVSMIEESILEDDYLSGIKVDEIKDVSYITLLTAYIYIIKLLNFIHND